MPWVAVRGRASQRRVLDVRHNLADDITLNSGTLYGNNGSISSTITLSQNSTIEARGKLDHQRCHHRW